MSCKIDKKPAYVSNSLLIKRFLYSFYDYSKIYYTVIIYLSLSAKNIVYKIESTWKISYWEFSAWWLRSFWTEVTEIYYKILGDLSHLNEDSDWKNSRKILFYLSSMSNSGEWIEAQFVWKGIWELGRHWRDGKNF